METSFIGGVIAASYDKLMSEAYLKSFEKLNRKDFLSLLKTHQYGKGMSHSFDQLMIEEEIKHKDFLESMIEKDHLIFKVLYLQFDHLFLSNMFKSYVLGVKYQKMIDGLSTFDEKVVETYIFEGSDLFLDRESKNLLDELILKTKELDAQALSDVVMSCLQDLILTKLDPKDKVIRNFLCRQTDILNVLLLIRVKKYQMSQTYLDINLLSGGYIDKDTLRKLYDSSFDELKKYLEIHYDEHVTDLLKDPSKEQFLTKISDELYKSLNTLIVDYSFETFGFAPVIHLTLLKRFEMTHLKQMFYRIKE